MSDILRINGFSKKLKIKSSNSSENDIESEKKKEEDYLQTSLQNYYDRGYNEGRESTRQELKAEFDNLLSDYVTKINSVINNLNEQTAGYSKIFESLVIDLAFMIAEKITHSELAEKVVIDETLKNSLNKVIGSNTIIAKLNPADLKIIAEKSNLFTNDGNLSHIKFEPDENISTGGCYVETEIGNVDSRISTQLDELKKIVQKSL